MKHAFVALMTLVLLGFTAGALAQPVAANSSVILQSSHPAVSMFVLPNGTGTPLGACYGPGGVPASVTILVTIRDASGLPVSGVTERDIRIAHAGTGMVWCADAFYPPPPHAPNCADVPTNNAGQTVFSLPYHGGGWHNTGMQIWVREASGLFAPIAPVLPVNMNSCDLNGDLLVNLSDVVTFTTDLQAWPAPYRSDFNWDGVVNLTDIVMFAQAIGVGCP